MSLDVYLCEMEMTDVFEANITHNLTRMADAAGIYKHLWRPEDVPVLKACELIEPLTKGLERMKECPEHFKQFDAKNGWGTYEQFLPWVERYLQACKDNPTAFVRASR